MLTLVQLTFAVSAGLLVMSFVLWYQLLCVRSDLERHFLFVGRELGSLTDAQRLVERQVDREFKAIEKNLEDTAWSAPRNLDETNKLILNLSKDATNEPKKRANRKHAKSV